MVKQCKRNFWDLGIQLNFSAKLHKHIIHVLCADPKMLNDPITYNMQRKNTVFLFWSSLVLLHYGRFEKILFRKSLKWAVQESLVYIVNI